MAKITITETLNTTVVNTYVLEGDPFTDQQRVADTVKHLNPVTSVTLSSNATYSCEAELYPITNKLLAGIELSQSEVAAIVCTEHDEDIEIVTDNYVEKFRWNIQHSYLIKVQNRYFQIYMYESLGEWGDNEYPEQVAVEMVPIEKMSVQYAIKDDNIRAMLFEGEI